MTEWPLILIQINILELCVFLRNLAVTIIMEDVNINVLRTQRKDLSRVNVMMVMCSHLTWCLVFYLTTVSPTNVNTIVFTTRMAINVHAHLALCLLKIKETAEILMNA